MALTFNDYPWLKELGLAESNPGVFNGEWLGSGEVLTSYSPTTGKPIATVTCGTPAEYEATIAKMQEASVAWMAMPAPKRGEVWLTFALPRASCASR